MTQTEPADDSALAVLHVGAAVTEDVMRLLEQVDAMAQLQTYRFQWAFIHSVEQASGTTLDLLSTVPTRDYPYSKKWWWGTKSVVRGEGGKHRLVLMPFVNILGLKQITRFISAFVYIARWAWQNRRCKHRILIVNGLIISHLYAAQIVARLSRSKVVAILTDPPTMRQKDEGAMYALARHVDRACLRASLRRLDGLIVLARALAERLAPNVPFKVVEGVISDEVIKFTDSNGLGRGARNSQEDAPLTVMYAGTLNEKYYGIEVLLDTFAQLQEPGYRLWIFGRGRLEDRVRIASERDSRIVYWGLQPAEVIFSKIREADVLVNPRPENECVTQFSFPSKLLEYMAVGSLVVGARLSGIPAEYHHFMVSPEDMAPDQLAACLQDIAGWPEARRELLRTDAQQFVWANKTQMHQGRHVMRFLSTLCANGA